MYLPVHPANVVEILYVMYNSMHHLCMSLQPWRVPVQPQPKAFTNVCVKISLAQVLLRERIVFFCEFVDR